MWASAHSRSAPCTQPLLRMTGRKFARKAAAEDGTPLATCEGSSARARPISTQGRDPLGTAAHSELGSVLGGGGGKRPMPGDEGPSLARSNRQYELDSFPEGEPGDPFE